MELPRDDTVQGSFVEVTQFAFTIVSPSAAQHARERMLGS